jgi:two-component system LytT family response regulator
METRNLTAVIVEDVPASRENLMAMIHEHCQHIDVVASAASVVEAAKAIRKEAPDILFLDIELGNETAFDLLDIIPDIKCQIIFTTASEEYAIKAFRYAAIDYLLKPIDPDELVEATQKLSQQGNTAPEQIEILNEQMNINAVPGRLALHTMDRMFIIDIQDIQRCEADGNYTKFYIAGKTPLLVTRTLKDFDRLLKGAAFIRTHQSHLVNAKHISEFVKVDGGYLVMKDGSKVPVSTRKRSSVIQQLEGVK